MMTDKRVTMIKPVVGKVKSPSYSLPDNDFVYGIESQLDKENAGKVVTSWAQSKPSSPPKNSKSVVATNREALKHGCLTSKSQREYGQKYPVMKSNPKKQNNSSNKKCSAEKTGENGEAITSIYQESTQPHQPIRVFGIQSKKNNVSMTKLLQLGNDEDGLDERDYPDLSGKQVKGRLPPAKATKASLIVAKCREPLSEDEMKQKRAVEEFKLKKFMNVKPRVNTRRMGGDGGGD